MFSFIKNYKLNKLLSDSIITTNPSDRLSFFVLESSYLKTLDPSTVQGLQNFKKIILSIYTEKDQKIRLKIMMLVHYLMKKHEPFCDVFLGNYKNQFNGNVQNYGNKASSFVYQREKTIQSKIGGMSMSSVRSNILPTMSSLTSVKTQDEYSNVHNYIYLHIIIPYHTYLIKFASSFHRHTHLLSQLQHSTSFYNANQCWKFLNILKSVSILKIPITNIGRYYKTQILSMIDLIEIISEDLILLKIQLEKQLQNAFGKYWLLGKDEMESVLLQTEEMLKENQNLFEIFKNRYYFRDMVWKIEPRWFQVGEGGVETMERYYEQRWGWIPKGYEKTERSLATRDGSVKDQ